MAIKNPKSPAAHSCSPANKSGEINQTPDLNISFRGSIEIGNKSGNEGGKNNRTTSSPNQTVEGEYCQQNQELNITFGNISFNSDSGNEQTSIVEKMVKTIAGATQTQLIKFNYAPVKMEDKESQTVNNQNKNCCKCSTGSKQIDKSLTSDVTFKNLENSEDGENHKDKFIGFIHKYIKTLGNLFAFSKFQILGRRMNEVFKQPSTQDEVIEKIELLKYD